MSTTLTPVLNTDTCRIVMLPLSNKAVINQGQVFHHLSTNIPAIDNKSYQALSKLLGLAVEDTNNSRNYFIERCMAFVGDDKPVVSAKGYGFIFDLLCDAGFNLKLMIERLDYIIYSWNEEAANKVLERTYSDQDDMVTRLSAADILEAENVTEAFITSYQDGSDLIMLYGDSGLKLTA